MRITESLLAKAKTIQEIKEQLLMRISPTTSHRDRASPANDLEDPFANHDPDYDISQSNKDSIMREDKIESKKYDSTAQSSREDRRKAMDIV